MRPRHNTQMFALASPPPERIEVAGAAYSLVRVFKHDFFAATCLYESLSPACQFGRIVVKIGRQQVFCGIPLRWYGRMLQRHELQIYRRLHGVAGIPGWLGTVGETGFAIEYIDARPLDHHTVPPGGFFDRLRAIFDAIHARGVAYCDSNKRSNILVRADGTPALIDYQISIRRRDDLPWPFRAVVAQMVRYMQKSDLYHLYKHKRRLAPDELTAEEKELSRRRGRLHTLHRLLTTPWRALRRAFLRRQTRVGELVSPTRHLEDHHQPEKATWRQ